MNLKKDQFFQNTNITMNTGPQSKVSYPTDNSFFKIPLKKHYDNIATSQDRLKRDFTIICNTLEKRIANETNKSSLLNLLDKVLEKLEYIHKRTHLDSVESKNSIELLSSRIQSVSEHMDSNDKDKQVCQTNSSFRIDCALLEYLAKKGFFQTAELLASKKGISHMLDLPEHKEYFLIISSLQQKVNTEALNWCQRNRSKLFNSEELLSFEMDLHLKKIIDLAKENRLQEALDYLKQNITKEYTKTSDNVKKVITFITFNDCNENIYKELDNSITWEKLIKRFDHFYFSIVNITPLPTIELLVQSGLSCIKMNDCSPELSASCPACNADWNNYAQMLPYPQHLQTSIFCPITNNKISLDSGGYLSRDHKIYSKDAIDELIAQDKNLNTTSFKRIFFT